MLWLWLSYRFEEEAFPGRAGVEATAEALCLLLDKGLKRITRMSKAGRDVAGRVRGGPAGRGAGWGGLLFWEGTSSWGLACQRYSMSARVCRVSARSVLRECS